MDRARDELATYRDTAIAHSAPLARMLGAAVLEKEPAAALALLEDALRFRPHQVRSTCPLPIWTPCAIVTPVAVAIANDDPPPPAPMAVSLLP